jgi:hypothetical protein
MSRPSLGQPNPRAKPGDVNFDGLTDQIDLVQVAQRGKYLEDVFASFEDGDWNGDGRFDQLDFVVALRAGSFVDLSRG